MADVKLPVVGGVSKKALAIGGISAAGVVALFWLRKRNAQSASAAPAVPGDTSSTGATGTGDYVDPGLQDTSAGPVYGATGYQDPNTGQWIYGNTGTGQAAATTNQQWSQMAIAYLTQNGGADPGTLAAALGKYLGGQAVTPAEEGLIDQAIAVEGYPPTASSSGYPPGIRTQGSGGQSGGGGVTGGGHLPAPSGLHVSNKTAHEFSLAWTPVHGSAGYRVQVKQLNGKVLAGFDVPGPGATVAAGTHPGYTYHVGVQALPGGTGANITVTLPRK